jgi:hypothetical protein
MEINPRSLPEPANDPSSFAMFERSMGMEFVLEDPFAGDDISARWSRNQCPGPIGEKGIMLLAHGSLPFGIAQCGANRCWRCRRRCGRNMGVLAVRQVNASTRPRDHG